MGTLSYYQVYITTCLNYQDQSSDFKEGLLAQADELKARNPLQVMVGVQTGDANDAIDTIIR